MTDNLKAFLAMISHSEGTDRFGDQGGYNVLVGGGLFHDFSEHPHKVIDLGHGLKSSAAGRYQLLGRYWDVYKVQLHLPDFGPDSQDRVAIQQIKECKALGDIEAGNIESAIRKCCRIWASLPGSGYGQRENAMAPLVAYYQQQGGEVA